MTTTKKAFDAWGFDKISFCELCDQSTPHIWAETESGEYGFGCESCFTAYGDDVLEFQKGIK